MILAAVGQPSRPRQSQHQVGQGLGERNHQVWKRQCPKTGPKNSQWISVSCSGLFQDPDAVLIWGPMVDPHQLHLGLDEPGFCSSVKCWQVQSLPESQCAPLKAIRECSCSGHLTLRSFTSSITCYRPGTFPVSEVTSVNKSDQNSSVSGVYSTSETNRRHTVVNTHNHPSAPVASFTMSFLVFSRGRIFFLLLTQNSFVLL